MNWLDVVLALIIAASAVCGFRRGFARVAVGLAACVLGVMAGLWFHGTAGSFLMPYVSWRGLANFIGFLLVFAGVMALGGLVGWALAKLLKWAGLGWLDRLGGAALGLLRGLLIAIVLVMALVAFSKEPPPRAVVQSRIAPYVIEAARVVAAAAPRELKDAFQASYDKIKQVWAEALKKGLKNLPKQEL